MAVMRMLRPAREPRSRQQRGAFGMRAAAEDSGLTIRGRARNLRRARQFAAGLQQLLGRLEQEKGSSLYLSFPLTL
jgi:hypothetical protein